MTYAKSGVMPLLKKAHEAGDPDILIDKIPYAQFLGIQSQVDGDKITFHLPPKKSNVGNPMLQAIQGGALGGFLETSALLHLMTSMDMSSVPKVIDFSIDYVRAGLFKDLYAECQVVRYGRKMVNIGIVAWHDDRSVLIARARAQFLIS